MEVLQPLFNIVVTVAGFLAAFILNGISTKIQKLEDALSDVPKEYVQKDDYRADLAEVKRMLTQIYETLNGKQDKA